MSHGPRAVLFLDEIAPKKRRWKLPTAVQLVVAAGSRSAQLHAPPSTNTNTNTIIDATNMNIYTTNTNTNTIIDATNTNMNTTNASTNSSTNANSIAYTCSIPGTWYIMNTNTTTDTNNNTDTNTIKTSRPTWAPPAR